MRPASVAAAFVGLALTACGATDPAGVLPPASSPTTAVPGTGEPYDPAADLRPELMTVTPGEAAPGDQVELMFPEETLRGVAFVLELAAGDSWSATHFLTSSTDGYSGTPTAVPVDAADGLAWEDIGIVGPGPDRLVLPGDAAIGASRICTANAVENFCAEITVVATEAGPTSTVVASPDTTTPATTVAPVPIVGVHEDVSFYPACGNESLTFDDRTWYQLNPDDDGYAVILQAFADAERDPSPVVGRRGFAPAVVEPGPGDDVGTLVIWADGVARWVSESGDLDVWMVDDEITYNWEC